MVYRNPYQGYSDQDYGYTTDDDHLKGHYGRYNGTAQYGQEEYIHQNGYSTQVGWVWISLSRRGLETIRGFV